MRRRYPVNPAYEYLAEDIDAILGAQTHAAGFQHNQTIPQYLSVPQPPQSNGTPTPPIWTRFLEGCTPEGLGELLRRDCQQLQEAGITQTTPRQIMAPINFGNGHWVGIRLNIQPDGINIMGADSFGHSQHAAMRVGQTVLNTLKELFPEQQHVTASAFSQPLKQNRIKNGGVACGACTVEHLMDMATRREVRNYRDLNALRQEHIDSLRLDPEQQSAFERRQFENRIHGRGWVLGVSGPALTDGNIEQIFAIADTLERFEDPALKQTLQEAFSPPRRVTSYEDGTFHRDYLKQIRGAIQTVVTTLSERGAVATDPDRMAMENFLTTTIAIGQQAVDGKNLFEFLQAKSESLLGTLDVLTTKDLRDGTTINDPDVLDTMAQFFGQRRHITQRSRAAEQEETPGKPTPDLAVDPHTTKGKKSFLEPDGWATLLDITVMMLSAPTATKVRAQQDATAAFTATFEGDPLELLPTASLHLQQTLKHNNQQLHPKDGTYGGIGAYIRPSQSPISEQPTFVIDSIFAGSSLQALEKQIGKPLKDCHITRIKFTDNKGKKHDKSIANLYAEADDLGIDRTIHVMQQIRGKLGTDIALTIEGQPEDITVTRGLMNAKTQSQHSFQGYAAMKGQATAQAFDGKGIEGVIAGVPEDRFTQVMHEVQRVYKEQTKPQKLTGVPEGISVDEIKAGRRAWKNVAGIRDPAAPKEGFVEALRAEYDAVKQQRGIH